MASPTSSIRSTEARRARGGFTLTEVLISFGIASFVMTGVMTTFLMMGRSGIIAQNYVELEVEARKALEIFSRDARMANGVVAFNTSSVTFSIPDSSSNRTAIGSYARYTFDATNKLFTRETFATLGGAVTTSTLVTNVVPIDDTTPYIRYFKYIGSSTPYASGFVPNYALNKPEIKQVELNFIAKRNISNVALASATDKVLSARFILRNK